jgi:hypothetical protein
MGNRSQNSVVIRQNDCLSYPTKKQLVDLCAAIKIDKSTKVDLIANAMARNGVFWSDRKNTLVAGNLTSGNRLEFKEFFNRIKSKFNENNM